MNASTKIGSSLALVPSLLVTACGGPEDGLPIESSVVTIALTAASTDESAVAVRSEDAALSIEEAGVALRSIELVPCSTDAAAIALADFPVDLALEPASRAAFESGVDDYCDLALEIAPSEAAEPQQLEGRGFFVRGVRSDAVPFEIRSALALGVVLPSTSGTAFGAGYLALGFDLATWFDGVDVSSASVTDGVALVDAETNAELLAAFEGNTSAAIALYVDADRDGVLDADELDPIATAE